MPHEQTKVYSNVEIIPSEAATPLPEPKLLRVAAYCRVSTKAERQKESIEIQTQHYEQFIRNVPGWMLVGIYTDNGITGVERKKRPGFQRLIRHCESGKIDRVLCKSVSRFSRNSQQLIEVVNTLKEKQVGIYFEQENIDTLTISQDFLLHTFVAIAQQDAYLNSELTNMSFRNRFKNGIPQFRRILGYQVSREEGRQVVTLIESEAAIVREIFELYISEMGASTIARMMMAKGYRTAGGKSVWTSDNIIGILKNERYTGNVISQKTYTVDYLTKAKCKNKGERTRYYLEDFHPAIISQELFDRIAQVFQRNQADPRAKNKTYPLSKRILCGKCGKPFWNIAYKPEVTWYCSTRVASYELCDALPVRDSMTLNVMKQAFKARYGEPERLTLKSALRDLEVINRNDSFELSRLNLNTLIRLATTEAMDTTGAEQEQAQTKRIALEGELATEEAYWSQLEQDRDFRQSALTWLEGILASDSAGALFEAQLNLEYLRAWVMDLTVYPDQVYEVTWLDRKTTKVLLTDLGNYQPRTKFIHRNGRRQTGITPKEKQNLTENKIPTISTKKQPTKAKPVNQRVRVIPILSPPISATKREDALRVCAYCRVSTQNADQLSSYHVQVSHYYRYILQHPSWQFAGIYTDRGASGTNTDKRPSFKRMIEDCQAGKIDMIITKSISRFSRDSAGCLETIRLLKSLPKPVKVYFERENLYSLDDSSEVMLTLLTALSQEEVRGYSENQRWNAQKRHQLGQVEYAGKRFYGYGSDQKGNWAIIEAEAEVVKRIYKEFMAGRNYSAIASDLTKDGIKTVTGLDYWVSNRIRVMIRNEKYAGIVRTNKRYVPNYLEHKLKPNLGQVAQYIISDHHPAIIPLDEWEMVQREADRRYMPNKGLFDRRTKPEYRRAFQNMFTCADCGSRLVGRSGEHRKTHPSHFNKHKWRCVCASGDDKRKHCSATSLSELAIEDAFMAKLLEFKHDLNSLIRMVNQEIERIQLTDCERERVILMEAQLDQTYQKLKQPDAFVSQLIEDLEAIKQELETYRERQDLAKVHASDLKWFLETLSGIPEYDPNTTRIPFREDIFTRLVKSAVASDDGVFEYQLSIGISCTTVGNDQGSWTLKRKTFEPGH